MEIMNVILPAVVAAVDRSMPSVPHLAAPIGQGWARFPPASFVCYLAWALRGSGDTNRFVGFAARRGVAFDMAREGPVSQPADAEEVWLLPEDLTFSEWAGGLVQLPAHILAQFFRDCGIAWHIMREYAPASVVQDALHGPSAHTTCPGVWRGSLADERCDSECFTAP